MPSGARASTIRGHPFEGGFFGVTFRPNHSGGGKHMVLQTAFAQIAAAMQQHQIQCRNVLGGKLGGDIGSKLQPLEDQ